MFLLPMRLPACPPRPATATRTHDDRIAGPEGAVLEFRTLGKIELRGDDGTLIPEPLRHTKRIALLAYLATPDPSRSHRRETLIALLWPELDEHHGRGMLRHELYELRRALGPEILFSEGREAVGVDGDRLWCDARAFGEHLAEAQLMEALDLVRGEFLPGLQVNGGSSTAGSMESALGYRVAPGGRRTD